MAGLMDIGKSGLQSYREALSVTGQNIANINTDGYKRREASLEEVTGTSGGLTSVSSQAGLGVRVDEVRRAFDEFLLNKARNATSYAASAESYLETVSQLENILIPGESNIGASIARFMESLQEVAANPNLIAPRIVALKAGESLTNSFHQTATLIKELQAGINTQSEQALSEINLLSANLANVNRNIASSGGKAQNALLDNRDAIIDKLSEYV
ncbi:MAG: flagellar hook-associated protein FlgK, partial [Alphaproteobacteria bacterium]|nr:flagellar hook-associated protein FlgK [Alphaproteobacteria bacterium]